ncbi:MAG: hypothetical protein J0H49_10655 [Acidobacteria bacterium]|nr:hypothetical protein [Acidobacteriota bacterium]
MPDNRMQIEITADSRQAKGAINDVASTVSSLDRQLIRIANQIQSAFSGMARQISQALDLVSARLGGLDRQAQGLVDHLGRPIRTSVVQEQVGSSAGFGGGTTVAAAAMINRGSISSFMKGGSVSADTLRSLKDNSDAQIEKLWRDRQNARSRSRFLTESSTMPGLSPDLSSQMNSQAAVRSAQAADLSQSIKAAVSNSRMYKAALGEIGPAANSAKGATDALGESMGSSMLKAGAMYAAFEGGIAIVKELTIESTKLAAETQMYGVALEAVSKSSGYSTQYLQDQAKAVKDLGITTRESRQAIIQMSTARMDVSAAPKLARMAQNLAVMRPEETSSSMFSRLIYGIQSGQTDVLRTAGVNVNFENEYSRFAKSQKRTVESLSEEEKVRLRLSVVLAQQNRFEGMYEQAMGTTGKQMQSLKRFTEEAQIAIGNSLIPALSALVTMATWAAQKITENPMVAKFLGVTGAGAIGAVGGALVGGAIGSVVPGAGTMAGAALGAKIGGGIGLAAGTYSAMQTTDEERARTLSHPAYRSHKQMYDYMLEYTKAPRGERGGPPKVDSKRAKEYADALRSLRDEVAKALAEEKTGVAKIIALRDVELSQLKAKGDLTKKTAALVNAKAAIEINKFNRAEISDIGGNLLSSAEGSLQAIATRGMDAAAKRDQLNRELYDADRQAMEDSLSAQMDILKRYRDRRIAEEDQGNAITLSQKLSVEQRKLAIDVFYLDQAKAKEKELLDFKAEVAKMEVAIRWSGNQSAIDQLNAQIDGALTTAKKRIDQQYGDQIRQAQLDSTRTQTAMVREEWMRAWEGVKNGGERLFDSLISKTESFGDAVKSILKAAFLTPMREIAGSFAARLFTPMAFSMRQAMQGVAATQMGGFGGIIPGVTPGTTPPFLPSMGGGFGQIMAIPGMPGFGIGANGQIMSAQGMPGQKGGLAGMLSNFPVFGTKSAQGIFGSSGKMGKFGGAAQSGLMMAGMMLGMDGWNRGGWGGALELTGAGASIGMAFGGPVGAAIGAGVGFTVGAFKALFGKTSSEKMKQAVREVTGVRVDDKKALQQMIQAAGKTDYRVWARSQAGQEMIQTYADMTGQQFKSVYSKPQFQMSLSGGSVFESATYSNGLANSIQSSLPGIGFGSLDMLAGAPSSGPATVVLKLDGDATTKIMQGEAVQVITDNPRLVSGAVAQSMSQNSNRFQIATAGSPTQIRG